MTNPWRQRPRKGAGHVALNSVRARCAPAFAMVPLDPEGPPRCQSSPRPRIDRRNVAQIMATPSLLDTGLRCTLNEGDRQTGRWFARAKPQAALFGCSVVTGHRPRGGSADLARAAPSISPEPFFTPWTPTGHLRGMGWAARAAKKPEWGQQLRRQVVGPGGPCAPFGRAAARLSRAGDRRSPIERNWLARYRNG
jgi:hypothetical protein